jgi:hypothetical protein
MFEVRGLRRYFVGRHNPLARIHHPDHVIPRTRGQLIDSPRERPSHHRESGSGQDDSGRTNAAPLPTTGGTERFRGRDVFALAVLNSGIPDWCSRLSGRRFKRSTAPHVGSILEEPLSFTGWRRH